MRWVTILLTVGAALVQGKDVPGPSQFYVVSEFFSDNGALFYYRVIDVHQEGGDTLIRYTRVAPVRDWCPRIIVQSAEKRLAKTTPAALVRRNNPCAVRPNALRSALRRYHRQPSVFETISFGVVAQCGSSSVVLRLPIEESVNMRALKRAHPEMARLWDLPGHIEDSVFGTKDIFHDRSEEDERRLQQAGQKEAPELLSGRFDAGLIEASRGGVGNWKSPSFRALLENYKGPVSQSEVIRGPVPALVNSGKYSF